MMLAYAARLAPQLQRAAGHELVQLVREREAADAVKLAAYYRKSGISVGMFPFSEGKTKQDYEELALHGGYEAVIRSDKATLEKAGIV